MPTEQDDSSRQRQEITKRLPKPREVVFAHNTCQECKHWVGLKFFGVPLLCKKYHDGWDWGKDDCQDWEWKRASVEDIRD